MFKSSLRALEGSVAQLAGSQRGWSDVAPGRMQHLEATGHALKTRGLHVLLVFLSFGGEDMSYHIWLCNLQLLINLKFQHRFL